MTTLPRAVFLCESPRAVPNAYDAATKARLRKLVALDDTVCTKADIEKLADVRYIFSTWGMPALTEEEIARMPELRAVFYAAGSVQQFARPFIKRGIAVHSAWAANAVPVAEVAYAEILLANKGFFQAQRIFRSQGKPAASAYYSKFPGNYNVSVGILGVGMIGSLVAKKLRANDITVRVYDPYASDEKLKELGAVRAQLPELFESCQTISCHLANNEATRGMLNYALFSRMLPTATFINTGRGAQVVEADLVRALTEYPSRTAVMDVTFPEPPEEGHPFYTLPNVYLTPHLAGSFGNEVARMGAYMCDECEKTLHGEPTLYRVTEKMLETMA